MVVNQLRVIFHLNFNLTNLIILFYLIELVIIEQNLRENMINLKFIIKFHFNFFIYLIMLYFIRVIFYNFQMFLTYF